MSVLISIIVPCYNQAQYLDECLKSVLDQTYQNWECIIINDGSPDHTEEVAMEWCKKDNRFIYLKKENGGLSSARNAGISLAQGTYILPLDSDDYISNNYLEVCYNEIRKTPLNTVVYGKAIKFGVVNCIWDLPEYSFETIKQRNMIVCTALYKKSDWERVGGYDSNMVGGLEDWEFWISLLKNGGNAINIKECALYYRVKEKSMLLDLNYKNNTYYNLRKYVFEKHHEVYTEHCYYELYLKEKQLQYDINHLEAFLTIGELKLIYLKKIKSKMKSFFLNYKKS